MATGEFYKLIECEGLPEPRRMKQLLTWCGERALSDKPQHGSANSGAVLGGTFAAPLLIYLVETAVLYWIADMCFS